MAFCWAFSGRGSQVEWWTWAAHCASEGRDDQLPTGRSAKYPAAGGGELEVGGGVGAGVGVGVGVGVGTGVGVGVGAGVGVAPALGVGVGEGFGCPGREGVGRGLGCSTDAGSVDVGSPNAGSPVDAGFPLDGAIATGPRVLPGDQWPSGFSMLFRALLIPTGKGWRRANTMRKQRKMAMTTRTRLTRSKLHLLHRPVHDNGGCKAIRNAPPFIDRAVSEKRR